MSRTSGDGKRKRIERGDVFWVILDPTVGSEIKKTRPAIIVSNDSCNAFGTRVLVMPLTSNTTSLYYGEVMVKVKGKSSRALGDQIRSIDKQRLGSRIGRVSKDEMSLVDEALRITFAL